MSPPITEAMAKESPVKEANTAKKIENKPNLGGSGNQRILKAAVLNPTQQIPITYPLNKSESILCRQS